MHLRKAETGLKRAGDTYPREVIVGPFAFVPETGTLRSGKTQIVLRPKVAELLNLFIDADGELVRHSDILARLWPEGFIGDANIWQTVRALRSALGQWGACIVSVPAVGYRCTLPISRRIAHGSTPSQTLRHSALLTLAILTAVVCFPIPLADTAVVHGVPATVAEYQLGRRNVSSLERAVKNFALAGAGSSDDPVTIAKMAEAQLFLGEYRGAHRYGNPNVEIAERLVRRSLDIDPSCALALALRGYILGAYHNDEKSSPQFLAAALRIDDNLWEGHLWRGALLIEHGQLDSGTGELERAYRLNPISPVTSTWLASAAYSQHNYSRALSLASSALELDPDRPDAQAILGLASEQMLQFGPAYAAFAKLSHIRGYERDAKLLMAHVLVSQNHRQAAALLLRSLRPAGLEIDFAAVLTVLGRGRQALAILKAGSKSDEDFRLSLKTDPRLTPLYKYAAYRQLAS